MIGEEILMKVGSDFDVNSEASLVFEEYLKNVEERHKSKVQVVAHSMGGLLTYSVLQRRPDLFHRHCN
jgi:alpha-beta hydrolase superfamily lysophospholipase